MGAIGRATVRTARCMDPFPPQYGVSPDEATQCVSPPGRLDVDSVIYSVANASCRLNSAIAASWIARAVGSSSMPHGMRPVSMLSPSPFRLSDQCVV